MKFLLVFFVATITVSTATAQINLGVKGGVNVVNMAFGSPSLISGQSQYRLSYHVGIYEQSDISDRFSVRPEVLFSNKGFRSSDALGKSSVNLYYLSLPILAQYRIWDQLSVVLGPEVSYLLFARARTDAGSVNLSSVWNRTLDVGIAVGLSYQVNEEVELGVRYTQGLLNAMSGDSLMPVDELDPVLEAIDWKSQNRVFQLSVGYQLK